jgi:hypothetical protein
MFGFDWVRVWVGIFKFYKGFILLGSISDLYGFKYSSGEARLLTYDVEIGTHTSILVLRSVVSLFGSSNDNSSSSMSSVRLF